MLGAYFFVVLFMFIRQIFLFKALCIKIPFYAHFSSPKAKISPHIAILYAKKLILMRTSFLKMSAYYSNICTKSEIFAQFQLDYTHFFYMCQDFFAKNIEFFKKFHPIRQFLFIY